MGTRGDARLLESSSYVLEIKATRGFNLKIKPTGEWGGGGGGEQRGTSEHGDYASERRREVLMQLPHITFVLFIFCSISLKLTNIRP